jgi:lysozyme-like protein
LKSRAHRKRPTHWFYKTLFIVYLVAIIWSSLTHSFNDKVSASSLPSSSARYKFASNPPGQSKVRAYVEGAARTKGVSPQIAEWIVTHESSHNPQATGDGGESRGLWQINKAWHPEVSDDCAYNVTCSTNWSLERIRAGHVDEWSTWKYCKERFDNCPFASR